jgi:hypothetical protein
VIPKVNEVNIGRKEPTSIEDVQNSTNELTEKLKKKVEDQKKSMKDIVDKLSKRLYKVADKELNLLLKDYIHDSK